MQLSNLLPPIFSNEQVWRDLLEVMQQVFDNEIFDGIAQLKNLRDPDDLERELLILTARMLGFNYRPDLLTYQDYVRFCKSVSEYHAEKGNAGFFDFVGWIKNTRFTVLPQWAKLEGTHYSRFATASSVKFGGDTVFDGSNRKGWFPTSHVDITYDSINFPLDSEEDLKDLFYSIAPINLVLRLIYASISFEARSLYVHTHTSMPEISRERFYSSCQLEHRTEIGLLPAHTSFERFYSSVVFGA